MKLKKHIFTILLVVLLFLLIGSVSAADTNDTQIISASDNDILSVENDVNVLGEGEYSYTQLKDQFRFDGDITLTAGNYTYVSGDGDTIEITTSRVIDGNGAVIDMANSGHRAFSVTTDGVTIKNLTIKNANFNGNGGAIYFSSSGTVENCNFTDNKATGGYSFGGAIYMNSGSVENCNFTNNKASFNGGAVYFYWDGTVTNCNFTNNTASIDGGAINMGSGTVTNCNFTNNKAANGGAIIMSSGSVENCNFIGNNATIGGGAIWMGSGSVENCIFMNNDAMELGGGAVYFLDNCDVTNCNFTNNTATNGNGGAIRMSSGSVTNCNFTGNKATGTNSWGGAVYFYSDGDVRNCNFTDNEAYYGGAIRFDGEGNVTNCNFTGNTATANGGAVYIESTGDVRNCNFTANQATGDGGAVYFNLEGTVENCNFTNNKATGSNSWGGAIRMYSGSVTNCNFTNNTANYGGAIRMNSGSVTNCNFTGNTATDSGGAINIGSGTMSNCNFTGNTATGSNSWGGAISIGSGTVSNCNFTNNTAKYGDAIMMASGSVTNCNFTNNKAEYGGAVYISGEGTVENCNFTGNTATDSNSWGGAIRMNSGTVSNCNFSDNTATRYGGAIWMSSGSVENCNFTGNKATGTNSWGGAVYFYSDGDVRNCNFTDNSATVNGGAVYFTGTGNVTNCNFTGNTATANGGAVYFHDGTVSNCNFTNNTANYGGAVYSNWGGNIINCNFTNNQATGSHSFGGAVLFNFQGDVKNCNFTNNKASGGSGGAINMGSGSVTNCNFTGNTATDGGAIWMISGSVTNCNFTGNNATTGSAIYFYWESSTKTIFNSIFLNNRANSEVLEVIKNNNNITITFTGNDNLLNAIYSNDEVSFTNVTYWGANGIANTGSSPITPSRSNKEAGQNITVSIVINNEIVSNAVYVTDANGRIVLNRNVGDNYFIGVCHDTDSYYTEKVNTTSNNTKFNVNVTSQTTNNKTVNITAKSNIPNEVIKGKLLFILPNSTEINATYATNGTWWALHTFDDVGDYNISASYIGLDDVIINNGNISIRYEARVDVNNKTLNLEIGQNFTIVATTTPEGLDVTFVQDDSGVYIVDENGNVIALKEGKGSVLVKVGGDGIYAKNSTIVNVTVSKVPTEIKVTNTTPDLKVDGEIETGATLIPADAGNLTYTVSNPSIVKIEDGKIIALKEGNATITVSFEGNKKYLPAENKTINVTVSLNDASVSVNNDTLDLLIDDKFNLISTTEPKDLTVNYTSSNPSVVTVDNKGNVMAVSEGNATITVTVGGDGIYAENSTTVTVTVKKVPTEITVDSVSLDLFVGDETVIAANLTPAEAGNVSFTSSDENIVTVDDKGNIIAEGKGQAIITVSFKGDNKYAAAENKTITVNVSLNDASVTVDNDTLDLKVDETYKINATKHPDTILLDITYTSSDETVATVDEKGVVTAVGEGSAIITVSVGDGEIYAENSTNVTVTVSKVPTEITVLNDTIVLEVNDEVSAGATLTPGDAGNLTYTSSNSSVVKVEDGKIIALAEGNATITVSFKGDNKYAAAENKTISVTVNLKKASIIAEPDSLELIIGEDGSIYVTTNPEDLDYIFTSSDESVVTVQSKNRVGKVLAVGEGNATITVTINEEAYVKNSTTVNIAVNRNDTLTVTAQNLTKYYKDPQKFTVTVTDTKGQAVSNKTVEITINGITYTRTTDENGTAKLNINLDSGEYPVSVNVDDITVNSTVTVKSTIDASDVVKIFRNDTQYNAKFIDSNANILANIQVSFNINGIIYNRTTDGNGTAKLNINLDAGTYIITATNPVTGEMSSNTIKVISLIESDDLTKYYRNNSQFIVHIHSADGSYVGAGEEITFNINGVFYTRTTNATGHAKLNINLGQGNYTITTYYKNCSKGNNIEVLPILTAEDLVMKYMDGSQFKAKLVDGQGNPYPKQTVRFNINGIFYNGETDSDGIAKLNINLMAGEYIITSSYNGFNIANKITIRG